MLRPALILTLALAACFKDETISGQSGPEDVWVLASIDERPVTDRITIRFSEQGRATGKGPCNIYYADQTAPLPWIGFGPIAATERACPGLALETRYLKLLGQMAFAEVLGDTLLLTANDGTALTYRLDAP